MTKAPTPAEKSKKQRVHTKHLQNIDYTTIADWLRTVSCNNDSHLTGVVNGIPTFPLTTKAV